MKSSPATGRVSKGVAPAVPAPPLNRDIEPSRRRWGFCLLTNLENLFMICYEKLYARKWVKSFTHSCYHKTERRAKTSEGNGFDNLWRPSTCNTYKKSKKKFFNLSCACLLFSLINFTQYSCRDIKRLELYQNQKNDIKIFAVGWISGLSCVGTAPLIWPAAGI